MYLRRPQDLTPGKSKGVQKSFVQAPSQFGGDSRFGRKELFKSMDEAQIEMGDELSLAPSPNVKDAVDTTARGADASS